MSTAPKISTRKAGRAYAGTMYEAPRWEILVDGKVVGACHRRAGTTAGYWGSWDLYLGGRIIPASSKADCVKAAVNRETNR